jgi:DNA-directed RNA polymerase specialized sigma24 family protein
MMILTLPSPYARVEVMTPAMGRPPRPPADNPELAKALRSASRDIRRRQDALRALEERRNCLVRQAAAEGWTHQQIADVTGLTRGRIGQLAPREGPR